jgi:tRNA (mo5U34)-methyltransferase
VFDYQALSDALREEGVGDWYAMLEPLLRSRLGHEQHGDLQKWQAIIEALPDTSEVRLDLQSAAPGGDCVLAPASNTQQIAACLRELSPWRKGPFRICDFTIDAEWRSDLKWQRFAGEIAPLPDRKVLDVGCGNGYYALRMRGAGARLVIGLDPTLLYVCQFLALAKLLHVRAVHVLPVRLQDVPLPLPCFDTTFSMGVLYHQRVPQEHLSQLRTTLRSGGELVLETLVLPGDEAEVLIPGERYARMRNVWHLPTVPTLLTWLREAGFTDLRVVDVSATTTAEQRSTDWMAFESLSAALDPADPRKTIEGLPAPTRAVVICHATQATPRRDCT